MHFFNEKNIKKQSKIFLILFFSYYAFGIEASENGNKIKKPTKPQAFQLGQHRKNPKNRRGSKEVPKMQAADNLWETVGAIAVFAVLGYIFGRQHAPSQLPEEQAKKIVELTNKLQNTEKELTEQKNFIEKWSKDKLDNNGKQLFNQLNEKITSLKADLASAQKTILDTTSIVSVKQGLKTVQELLLTYISIRDQQHHNSVELLKKYIKSKKGKYQKYYMNQVVHKLLFYTLHVCYEVAESYKQEVYTTIGNILGLDNENDINQLVPKICSAQLKANPVAILKRKLGKVGEPYNKNIADQTLIARVMVKITGQQYYTEELQTLATDDRDAYEKLEKYVEECIQVCWQMLLQDPPLTLSPTKWKAEKGKVKYDEEKHKRVLGSDGEPKNVLYYIWPVIERNGNPIDDQTVSVVAREDFFSKQKKKA